MQHRKEIMSNEFTKHLLDFEGRAGNFHMVVHHFTAPDIGGPHDHPFSFTTHILAGGYIERRYTFTGDCVCSYEDIERKAGDSFVVEADTIHEIIALPAGECWTTIIPQAKTQEWGFWTFEPTKVWFRQHDTPERILIAESL